MSNLENIGRDRRKIQNLNNEKIENIKILINYHKPGKLLKNDIFVPIHVGRTLATQNSKDGKISKQDYNWLINNMIGDDTGDNISSRNKEFCELTGIYWAWKHYEELGNPDYIGFMTYRRHFIFNEQLSANIERFLTNEELTYGDVMLLHNIPNYENIFGITTDYIQDLCHNYDCIIPEAMSLEKSKIKSLEDDYANVIEGTNIKDYKMLKEQLSLMYPQYGTIAKLRAKQSKKIGYQMFICRKEIFFDYCNILFSTLFELDKKIDTSAYSINGKRTLGYLGELIFDTYFSSLISEENFNVKKLKITMIIDDSLPVSTSKLKILKYKVLKNVSLSKKKRIHYKNKYIALKKMQLLQGGL